MNTIFNVECNVDSTVCTAIIYAVIQYNLLYWIDMEHGRGHCISVQIENCIPHISNFSLSSLFGTFL